MSDLLTLAGVHTHIGRYHILQGVDFAVAEGGITMLLGRNGAGKTSTLRTIMGLWQASSGEIRLAGQRIERSATPDIARLGVGYVPESMAVFSDLTVRENLVLAARDGPLDDTRLEWIFGFFPALRRFWLSRAGSLSGGQKQMLSIARAIIEPRKLLLIDEPTKGLAPAIVMALIECLKEIKRAGVTILLVEQNFHAARELGDTVVVMDNGAIVHRGEMAALVPINIRPRLPRFAPSSMIRRSNSSFAKRLVLTSMGAAAALTASLGPLSPRRPRAASLVSPANPSTGS